MNGMMDIDFAPLIDLPLLYGLCGVAAFLVILSFVLRARGAWFRLLALMALAVALVNPSFVNETRRAVPDVAVIVVDDSPSQDIGDREEMAEEGLAALRGRLGAMDDVDVEVIRAGGGNVDNGGIIDETRLFEMLDLQIADIPSRRMAGVVLLTDGQVHDVPVLGEDMAEGENPYGPVHVFLTGEHGERDRKLSLVEAPAFGLVGREVVVKVRVDDLLGERETAAGDTVALRLSQDGGEAVSFYPEIGEDVELELNIDHAGQNIFELEVEAIDGEMSLANNRLAIVVNGVRDRLRVLLISGEPHPGERTWRNLLKADPSVDLIHFTILRPPESRDSTPQNELSLIAFPVHELFQNQLEDFDLIIFDRYRMRGVLPDIYLRNIANYVRGGGAVLEAIGPAFATDYSLYQTSMGEVLPASPADGGVMVGAFSPQLSELGERHPITSSLIGEGARYEPLEWGRWFRQNDINVDRGSILMTGLNDRPLLVVDRVEDGRVAQLASDHIWLWSRGFEGGGPQAELLRRLAHWLMQEPELEENLLTAEVVGNNIMVERRRMDGMPNVVEMRRPSSDINEIIDMEEKTTGLWRGHVEADEAGIYRFSDGELVAVAAVGRVNPPELADLRTSAAPLEDIIEKTGGGVFWLQDGDIPSIRRVRAGRDTAGRGWIGLRKNDDYVVDNVMAMPLLPPALLLLIAIGGFLVSWRREGQ